MTVKIKGIICPNDDKWFYTDFWGMDATCPNDVEKIIQNANGEKLIVDIDSPGGDITPASAIYTMLREYGDIEIHIIGQAHSAASIIAMSGYSKMAPTALMMVHCASTHASGNHNDMEKTAEILQEADKALSSAYSAKSGMSEEDALAMMEEQTWLTADHAKELGLIDEIMFEDESQEPMTASLFSMPTEEEKENARNLLAVKNKQLLQARERAENLRSKEMTENE